MGLLFLLENRLVQKMAYPLSQRYLHCRIIPIVFLVLIAATNVYTVSAFVQILDNVINAPYLVPVVNFLLPNRAYELVYMLLMILGLNLTVGLLMIVVIALTKFVFRFAPDYVSIDDYYGIGRVIRFPWLVVQKLYDDTDNSLQLSPKGRTLGFWVKSFKWAFAVLWIAEILAMAVSILWGTDDWNEIALTVSKHWYLLPMAAFLLLQQIQFFLEGTLGAESGTIGSVAIDEKQSGSITSLMDTYKQTYDRSGALLLSDVKNNVLLRDGLCSNDLGNQQIEDCRQPDILNLISAQLQQCGVRQREQYQNALVELLNGHSVNICDQCEGRFLPFLCAYLNYYLSQGRTALMLCPSRQHASELCDAVNREMGQLNTLCSVWNVSSLSGADSNRQISMLVVSIDDLLDYQVFDKRPDFVADLFCTVITDGVDLLSRDRLRTERLFEVLREKADGQQYIAFTRINNDTLRTALEQATKQELLPFSDDVSGSPDAGVMVWREESYYRLQNSIDIGSPSSPYMGAATPLALTSIKYDFPRVYVLGSDSHGTFAYNDVLAMSAKEVARYIGKGVNLRSLIRNQMDEALQDQELSVTVAYDTDHNFLNTMTFWQRYGGTEGSLLHIVSPPYALREYFVSNYFQKHFDLKNNAFNAMIPHYLGTTASRMLVILIQLCGKGLTEEELMEKAGKYHWHYDTVTQLLHGCLRTVLALDEIHSVYECFHFEEEKFFNEAASRFEVQTRVTLIDATIKQRLCALSDCAELISKDNSKQSLPILSGNVYNYCLPHQIIPVNGYLYKVLSISDGNIYAEQTLPPSIPEYYQLCDFTFRHYQKTDACVDIGCMNLQVCTAGITRNVAGYVSSTRGNEFGGSGDYLITSTGEAIRMNLDCANILEINFRASEFGDRAAEATRLFAYLLQDFAKTLFPSTHKNLFVAVPDEESDERIRNVLTAGNGADVNDLIRCMIPSIRDIPASADGYTTVYVIECSCVEYGMVQMLYSRYQTVMTMMREYLHWYLRNSTTAESADETAEATAPAGSKPSDSARYLHFGMDSIPDVFAPEALLNLCQKIAPGSEMSSESSNVVASAHAERCTFCGRPTMFPVILADKRRMCVHCKDHQLTQKNEIKVLFTDTVRFFTEGYRITLPKNLHVRFQSSEAIAREAGSVDGGRILGFYNRGNHQLWLEARGPKIAMQSTLIHELTHAWQHHSAEFSQRLPKVLRKFPRKKRNLMRLLILEGHAVYMEVETMYRMHEEAYAERIHEAYMQRSDEYGTGYRLVRDYLIQQSTLGSHVTPFTAMIQLLQDIIDGKVVISHE